ncbi:hypothetical protein Tco_1196126, partial [Tanacetum coccineum]
MSSNPAIRLLFKMEESQFSKFKGDKLRVLLEMETEKGKGLWRYSALSQRGQGILHDLGIEDAIVSQQTIPQNSTFQTKDLDAYDLDYDDLSSAKSVLIANLSSCDSDVLSEYLQETQNTGIQDTNSSEPNDLLVLYLVEQMTDQVANLDKENQTNKMVDKSLTAALKRYKEHVIIFEQRINVDSNNRESKEKESKYIDKEIVLEKQNKELENII